MDLRRIAPRLVAGLLLLATAALPLAAAPRECEALQQWARDNQASLPHDFAGLAAFPAKERQAIYGILSADEKAAFWRDKVSAYLVRHPELAAEQVAAIAEAAARIRPEIYSSADRKEADREAIDRELAEAAKKLIAGAGEQVAREAFFGLGGEEAGPTRSQRSLDPPTDICTCRGLWECPINADYCGNVVNQPCVQVTGCGFFGTQYCTGQCLVIS